MIKSLYIKNFTVFGDVSLQFGKHLNIVIGENGSGKTHLLKLAYSILAASWEQSKRRDTHALLPPNRLQAPLASKIVNVFRPEFLGRLARRRRGANQCDIDLRCAKPGWSISFSFTTRSVAEVQLREPPQSLINRAPAFIPPRELLTIYPNFVSVYETTNLEFEETWRDTCVLLGAPLRRGPQEGEIKNLLAPIEQIMGGKIELDRNGRFYLRHRRGGRMEMPLVAEGFRKAGMLARLIANGTLLEQGCLFWDEPEANLNPRIIRQVAEIIVELASHGIQIFIATHSLFLLRELDILLSRGKDKKIDVRFFGLSLAAGGAIVEQGRSPEDIGTIVMLEEELRQSDRFLGVRE